jgi:hypothetical protein
MDIFANQKHLSKKEMINLGSYYTKSEIVNLVYSLIKRKISDISDFTILDTSCGYGSFLNANEILENKKIGADIDKIAIEELKNNPKKIEAINHNSLLHSYRKDYGISEDEKLIIVGNPPYNDVTSIIRNSIKEKSPEMNKKFKTRDLGISFLRSYAELNPDFICVLHPLSYLIKKTNFNTLNEFSKKYKLIDSIIISSAEFNGTAPGKTYFPIIIGLYEKNDLGMDYEYIKKFIFKTKEGKQFSLMNLISINNFLSKYPNQNFVNPEKVVAKFWTMRDINALKRSKTFIEETNYNTIFVEREKLPYFCYVDVFKKYIIHIPYYFGNCDVFIDEKNFEGIKDYFIAMSARNNPQLSKFAQDNFEDSEKIIEKYFKKLLGEHYVEN